MGVIGFMGGTGFETLPQDRRLESVSVRTKFGEAEAQWLEWKDGRMVFIPRHGPQHGLAPHQVNYRANIAAMAELGVDRILATNAVGSLRLDLAPGSLVLLDDFIDFTRARPLTLFSDAGESFSHTDFSEPYCPELRRAVEEASVDLDLDVLPRGVYLCADGPRFETPAEVRLFAQWGADVVGMTGLPEAVFAREAGICYAALAVVTNFAAGLTRELVAHREVVAQVERSAGAVCDLLLTAAARAPAVRACRCGVTI